MDTMTILEITSTATPKRRQQCGSVVVPVFILFFISLLLAVGASESSGRRNNHRHIHRGSKIQTDYTSTVYIHDKPASLNQDTPPGKDYNTDMNDFHPGLGLNKNTHDIQPGFGYHKNVHDVQANVEYNNNVKSQFHENKLFRFPKELDSRFVQRSLTLDPSVDVRPSLVQDARIGYLNSSFPLSSVDTTTGALSTSDHQKHVAMARGLANCLEKYAVQSTRFSRLYEDRYQPYQCEINSESCRQCFLGLTSSPSCKVKCETTICDDTCDFIDSIIRRDLDEAGTAQNRNYTTPSPSENFRVTDVTTACLYTPLLNVFSGATSIVLKWNVLGTDNHPPDQVFSFLLQIQQLTTSSGKTSDWTTLGYTSENLARIRSVNLDSKYRFRVTAVTSQGSLSKPMISEWITPATAGPLLSPLKVQVYDQYVQDNTVKAQVRWIMPNRSGCFFKLHWMTPQKGSFQTRELKDMPGYRYELDDLEFESLYEVEIQTFDHLFLNSSATVIVNFTTPNCLESNNYNYNACAPDLPRDVRVTLAHPYDVNGTWFTDVTVTWRPPYNVKEDNPIEKYILSFRKKPPVMFMKHTPPHRQVAEIDKDATRVVLTGFHWDAEYVISIAAESIAGTGKKVVKEFVTGKGYQALVSGPDDGTLTSDLSRNTTNVYFVSLIPSLLTGASLLICGIYYIKRRRNIKKLPIVREPSRKEEINPLYDFPSTSEGKDVEELLSGDEYEVDYSCLRLTQTLGEGAFGIVMKATFTPPGSYRPAKTKIVAVKMLKEHATPEERRVLLLEISAMKMLGHHPHLVSILACVTHANRPCLIMDYCPLGDLRNYLRQRRIQLQYGPMDLTDSSSTGFSQFSSTGSHSNSGNSRNDNNSLTRKPSVSSGSSVGYLSQTTLLSYARQIALGMDFLSQNRFIHRDLACRNILMSTHQAVKISDFGLSRDVYEMNVYQPTSARKLPYKWMPVETIFDQVFTTKSDVWSYGILLWEIVTLGGCPYPGIANDDLFRLLSKGYRLEKPNNCSPEIYKIMLNCWHPNPKGRPSFNELSQKMERLLEATCSYIDLSVTVREDYYPNDSGEQQSDDDAIVCDSSCLTTSTSISNMSTGGTLSQGTNYSIQSDHDRSGVPDSIETSDGTGRHSTSRHSQNGISSSARRTTSPHLGSPIRPGLTKKRYSRLESLSDRISLKTSMAQICAHYPVSNGSYTPDVNHPLPGLSEELLLQNMDKISNRQSQSQTSDTTKSSSASDSINNEDNENDKNDDTRTCIQVSENLADQASGISQLHCEHPSLPKNNNDSLSTNGVRGAHSDNGSITTQILITSGDGSIDCGSMHSSDVYTSNIEVHDVNASLIADTPTQNIPDD